MPAKKESTPITFSIPRPTGSTPILVGLVIVLAFLLGMLFTKVQYLEKTATTAGVVAAPGAAAPEAAKPAGKIKPVSNKDHVRGNKDAKVAFVEFSDLECPFCKRFHPDALTLLKEYGDRVKFVFRHYPLSFHQNAQKEAEAAECIAELGGDEKFWEFIDTVFEKSPAGGTGLALTDLGPMAKDMGLDQAKFQECLDSGKYEQRVKDDMADGTTGGVSGTPSSFIIDSKGEQQNIVGAQPIDTFKAALDAALK
jgi:protein-disulfide isomerase